MKVTARLSQHRQRKAQAKQDVRAVIWVIQLKLGKMSFLVRLPSSDVKQQ